MFCLAETNTDAPYLYRGAVKIKLFFHRGDPHENRHQ